MGFRLDIDGNIFTKDDILGSNLENPIIDYCKQWFQGTDSFAFKTSGSTGKPKTIQLSRELLETSAHKTIDALTLKSTYTALLCINSEFIGGTQMITRAIIGDYSLRCVEPKSMPISPSSAPVDFISLVPLQLSTMLDDPFGLEYLNQCKTILVGGAAISRNTEHSLQQLNADVFQSYGMTETASHIALRIINGPHAKNEYQVLPGNQVTLSQEGCLVFKGDLTNQHDLITNDLGELKGEGQFKVLGRKDHTINSGGVKFIIENIEDKLYNYLGERGIKASFAISASKDSLLGEKIILVVDDMTINWEKVISEISWNRYEKPKDIVPIESIPFTDSEKVDRIRVKDIIDQTFFS